jgi:hypothetical protein
MTLPATPNELLTFLHNHPNPPDCLLHSIRQVLGELSTVTSIILLGILDHEQSGEGPATTAIIIEKTGRNVSTSQLDSLYKKGHLKRHTVTTKRCEAFGWTVAPNSRPLVNDIDRSLRRLIARTNAKIDTHLAVVRLIADYAGGEPEHIHSHHTLREKLGIDFTSDHDFTKTLCEHFNLRLLRDDLARLVTVSDLIHHIQHTIADRR